jgi:RNA polymerase sigma-70 factor (ECF subfamily)
MDEKLSGAPSQMDLPVHGAHPDDLSLADAVRRKDRKATAELVRAYADAIFGYVLARVQPNAADADDLTQEVFLAAYQSIRDYRGVSSLKAWLLGIARHKVEDYYRARVRNLDLNEADTAAAEDVSLDDALDDHRLRQRTRAALDRLPEANRLLLKWRYWDQRRTADIAAALGRTEKAVERMLARARRQFREQWEANL